MHSAVLPKHQQVDHDLHVCTSQCLFPPFATRNWPEVHMWCSRRSPKQTHEDPKYRKPSRARTTRKKRLDHHETNDKDATRLSSCRQRCTKNNRALMPTSAMYCPPHTRGKGRAVARLSSTGKQIRAGRAGHEDHSISRWHPKSTCNSITPRPQ